MTIQDTMDTSPPMHTSHSVIGSPSWATTSVHKDLSYLSNSQNTKCSYPPTITTPTPLFAKYMLTQCTSPLQVVTSSSYRDGAQSYTTQNSICYKMKMQELSANGSSNLSSITGAPLSKSYQTMERLSSKLLDTYPKNITSTISAFQVTTLMLTA
jgi:hypothetical protein